MTTEQLTEGEKIKAQLDVYKDVLDKWEKATGFYGTQQLQIVDLKNSRDWYIASIQMTEQSFKVVQALEIQAYKQKVKEFEQKFSAL